MRTERTVAAGVFALMMALSSRALAADDTLLSTLLSPARLSVALPLEAHVIGAAQGLHPEVLWQPFADDGATHLLLSAGFLPGLEYLFIPVDLGVRWTWKPWRFLQPSLGLGVENQLFLIDDGGPFSRVSFYAEAGTSIAVDDTLSVGAMVVPSLSAFGVPGPGLAGRFTLTWDLGS